MTELGVIGVIGGTGKLGSALARRWARAGLDVLIGSRTAESASARAAELDCSGGGTNADVAARARIVVVTVPFAAQETTLAEIAAHVGGKIVVDTTVPLMPPKVMRVQLPAEGSAAMRARTLLGEDVALISAFHNVAAHKLATDMEVDCDVLVFGDAVADRETGIALAGHAGLRGLHGGPLVNSAAGEALTSVMICLNKYYQIDGAGVRITGKMTPAAS
jgi:NADPH-dependent F420 reductase